MTTYLHEDDVIHEREAAAAEDDTESGGGLVRIEAHQTGRLPLHRALHEHEHEEGHRPRVKGELELRGVGGASVCAAWVSVRAVWVRDAAAWRRRLTLSSLPVISLPESDICADCINTDVMHMQMPKNSPCSRPVNMTHMTERVTRSR